MRFVFNYPCKVAVVTPEGDLGQLRFGVGEVVEIHCPPTCTLQADHRQFLNLELTSGYTLVNVPVGAVRIEPMCVRTRR